MRRVARWLLVAVAAVVLVVVAASVIPFRNLLDGVFNRETYTATGDVVLKQLRKQDDLTVSTGTFDVPVVVCRGKATAYPDRADADELLSSCSGLGAEKATVIVQADVPAVISLSDLE